MLTAGTPAGAPTLLLSEFGHPVAWVRETGSAEGSGTLDISRYAIVASKTGTGRWRYIFHTREHGAVDLDTLLAQMDSVLSGKRRGGVR